MTISINDIHEACTCLKNNDFSNDLIIFVLQTCSDRYFKLKKQEDLKDKESEENLSSCCGADIINTDICSECKEHCDIA